MSSTTVASSATATRWRIVDPHALPPDDACLASTASFDSGNCSDASSTTAGVDDSDALPPTVFCLPLSAFAPPTSGPLSRCSAPRRIPQPRSPLMLSSHVTSATPVITTSGTFVGDDHFVKRMDAELARIREAPVQIQNEASKYTLTLHMNVFRAVDIQLTAEQGRLIVEAEREVRVDAARTVLLSFVRKLTLPDSVATDALATRFTARGMLTITMLKRK